MKPGDEKVLVEARLRGNRLDFFVPHGWLSGGCRPLAPGEPEFSIGSRGLGNDPIIHAHPGVPIGELVEAVREWKREIDGNNPSSCAGEDRLYDLAARMENKP